MREIKFRAWDEFGQKMFTPRQLCNLAVAHDVPDWADLGTDTVVLMQYTGLKDSMVAEEYFGDVIEEDDGTRRVIEDGCSAVLFRDIKTRDIKYFWELKPHKVIGNIYENPELLEVESV